MSNDFFFNFSDSAAKESGGDTNEGATSWLFGGDGDNNGSVDGDPAVTEDSVQGADGFDLPVLKGQLFGTDSAVNNRDEDDAPLTLTQLMEEPNSDFPFDLSYNSTNNNIGNNKNNNSFGASASGLFGQDATAEGEGVKSKSNAAAVAAAAVAEKAKAASERGRKSENDSSKLKDDDSLRSSMNDPSKQGSSLASTFDLRRNPDNDGDDDDNDAGKPRSSAISRSKDHFGAFENENSSPTLEGSNSPKSANNKRVKWSGDVSGLGGQQRLGGATDASSKIGKIKSTKGTPEANKYGQRWDFGGAGDTGLRGTHSHKSGGGGGGTNMVHRQAASLKSQQSARVPGGSVNSGSHGGRSSHSGSRAGGDAGSAIGGSVGQQASPQQKGGQRLTNNKQPDRRSPGNKQPLIVPPVLQQQRQPQGILRPQQSEQVFQERFGLNIPRKQPPPIRVANSRQTPNLKPSTSAGRIDKADGDGRPGGNDEGSNNDASHHLVRPIASAFEQVVSALQPMQQLEKELDRIIEHLDDLDAKADAKLEELMLKKKNYLEATRKMQSAFK